MVERNLLTYNFGPKISTSNNQNKVSFKESMDTLMNTIDEKRRDEFIVMKRIIVAEIVRKEVVDLLFPWMACGN